jgi:hypothetical protein
MKTFLPLFAAIFTITSVNAQFSQNFEGNESSLTSNCWTLTDVFHTTSSSDVINGTGSMYTNPPTSGSGTRDIVSPALNVTSTSFTVSFKYKLSARLGGQATRFIEVGLLDPTGTFTSLAVINLDRNTPTGTLSFNQQFTLSSTGYRKLVLKLGGSTGDGNSRLIFDDLYASANPLYGSGTCNSSPIAVDDVFLGAVGSSITGNVLVNDHEPNGETMIPAMVMTSADGTVVLNANGTFTFTPNAGFNGTTTTFTYQLTDNGFAPAVSNIATVTLRFGSSIVILPVKMLYFNAQLNNNNKVDLKWATSSEVNTSRFIVERSADGKNFSAVGVVFAAGNSNQTATYQLTDNLGSADKTILHYRLRIVNEDETSELSSTRIIRLSKQAAAIASIETYPNPASNELRVTVPAQWQGKQVTYEMFTASGAVAKKLTTNNSSQTETFDITQMAQGFYMVKVTCGTETATKKIIKK